jgi:nitrate reductase gamma subunit
MVYQDSVWFPHHPITGASMASARAIPALVSILIGLVVTLVGWGLLRARAHEPNDGQVGMRDDLLLWLLMLAAFILGACLTYFLLNIGL